MPVSTVKSRVLSGLAVIALLAMAFLFVRSAAADTIEIDRARLDGGGLRVEGTGAVPDGVVTVTSQESTASDEADGDGEFRVEADGFVSSTCEVTVSDGVSSVQVTLSRCTPSADPTATPTSEPTATSEPTEEPTATTEPSATPTSEPTATSTPQPTATPADPTPTPEEEEPEPRIESLVFDPNPVPGGEEATGIITFTRALPEDTLVSLQSNRDDLASIPSQLIAPAGATVVTYPVTTAAPDVDTTFHMFATAFAVTTATELTVQAPPPPPDADIVEITRAQYKDGILSVRATSTSSDATLRVYLTSSGSFIFTLTNEGGGDYRGEVARRFPASHITVKSSLGGVDSSEVDIDD